MRQIARPRHELRKNKLGPSLTKNGHFYRNRKAHLPSNLVLFILLYRSDSNYKGNYEYPFDVYLPDDIPDSVEGLPGGAIIYKMKATVERTGLVNKNVTCRKVSRIMKPKF